MRPASVARLAALLLLLAGAAPAAEPDPALEGAILEVEDLLTEAHFRTALSVATATRGWADEIASNPEVRSQRARLQILIATAHVALSNPAKARASLRLALKLDPTLDFDPATHSPKLLRVLREVRS